MEMEGGESQQAREIMEARIDSQGHDPSPVPCVCLHPSQFTVGFGLSTLTRKKDQSEKRSSQVERHPFFISFLLLIYS